MNKIFYRVTFKEGFFSDMIFSDREHAISEINDHRRGCPSLPRMTKENREYWKKVGRGMRLFKVTETTVREKI